MSKQKVKLHELLGKTNPDKNKELITKKTKLSMVAPFSIGIEFELENLGNTFNKRGLIADYWQEVGDGSLRGDGREFITRTPLKDDDVILALENIYESAKGSMEPFTSLRTSAHVHVNALDMDAEEAVLFLAAGVLCEEYILSLNDEYRKFCGYCVDSTQAVASVISALFKSKSFRVDLNSRYFGVNPMSVNKHGTVEFRHFSVPATIEDAVRNINICLHLKKIALEVAATLKGPLTRKTIEEPLQKLKTDLETIFETNLIKNIDPLLTAIDMELVKDERWSNPTTEQANEDAVDAPVTNGRVTLTNERARWAIQDELENTAFQTTDEARRAADVERVRAQMERLAGRTPETRVGFDNPVQGPVDPIDPRVPGTRPSARMVRTRQLIGRGHAQQMYNITRVTGTLGTSLTIADRDDNAIVTGFVQSTSEQDITDRLNIMIRHVEQTQLLGQF
jgi:hypothetical protein